MKRGFLNQKLGKRVSRKAELHKAKLLAGAWHARSSPSRDPAVPGRNGPRGKPA